MLFKRQKRKGEVFKKIIFVCISGMQNLYKMENRPMILIGG